MSDGPANALQEQLLHTFCSLPWDKAAKVAYDPQILWPSIANELVKKGLFGVHEKHWFYATLEGRQWVLHHPKEQS